MNTDQQDSVRYPYQAGHQGGDTDQAASAFMEESGKAQVLREKVMKVLFCHLAGLTPDEAAALLRESVLNIRPRFTELKQQGRLVDTGMRRPSQSGHSQRVLKLAEYPTPL